MYEPALTAITPRAGGPAVSVVFTSLPPGTEGINLWREAAGRRHPVRGAVRARVYGAAGFLDAEAPFGVESVYYAEALTRSGVSLGFTGASATRLDSTVSWIHNPLNPGGAIPVRVATRTGSQIVGQNQVAIHYPVGRAAGVAVTGQRRGLATVPLAVWADTAAATTALDRMFGQPRGDLDLPPFLVVRLASQFTIPLPRPLFVAVPTPTMTPVNSAAGGSKTGWDVSGPEIDPPTPALAAALLSRADLDTFYPTRAARGTAYPTRLAMDTDYNLAGFGGGSQYDPVPAPVGSDYLDGTGSLTGTATDRGDGTGAFGRPSGSSAEATYGADAYGAGAYGQ